MGEARSAAPRRMSYARARALILSAGIALLALVAILTYLRGVDPKEVTATVLFIPIFLAFVFGGVPGGILAAIAASVIYAGIRYPEIQAVGVDRFSSLIASRTLAFVAFGGIGGWAVKQLESSVNKLELYDQIDDATGLFNARFFVQDTDLEITRSTRYRTIFSVSVVDIPSAALEVLARRQKAGLLKEFGRILQASIRTVDRAVHSDDGTRHRIGIVLPETGREGARIFTERLAERIREHLGRRGIGGLEQVRSVFFTFPEDEQNVRQLRGEFEAIERTEYPEPAETGAPGRGP
jgi:GGDEF domain-containing protein